MPNIAVYNKAEACGCVAQHCPSAYVANRHHVLPLSWGGLTVAANLVWLCPNAHTATHDLLNQYVHLGGPPPPDVQQHYTALSRSLAARAWAERTPGHTPYTIAHPGDAHA